MAKKITLTSSIQRNDTLVQATIDGETVMMNIDKGQYYGLDTIASCIWNQIDSFKPVAQICQSLQEEYEVDHEQCQRDVLNFLHQLAEQDAIEVSP